MSVYLTLPGAKLFHQAKPASSSLPPPALPGAKTGEGYPGQNKAMDQEREAEHVLISSPVRHCILINLTDFSKLELTFHCSWTL